MSVRCFQVLLAEAGRGGFLIVLEGSITIVLVACTCQCDYYKAGSCRQYGGDAHFGLSQAVTVIKCACRSRSMRVMQEKDGKPMRHGHGFIPASVTLGNAGNISCKLHEAS